ncbi:MAG TPA: acyl-CoA dehydrogenase [Anaerolineales bacterium]|nr:acyl-CoA dehydrogenase [Anaerolineales bacterium]HNA53180.1 acyl-CoA dehydrogenase [Anaerolineales bacterium]HNC87425.1 acyl-CoA dehydrogenase [Anaerolineales bacterium]HNE67010.1 acyl-CoA dehydrogenase [Anaerolineales bacterium]HNF36925.1 acyl-CoA dehydrogenase [Anaerolineales bacterium]
MTELPIHPLSDEHKMLRDAARDFAQKEIAPIAAEFDESGEFPYATIRKMGELGFMGIEIPEEYGGAGMDALAYVLALEEICKVDASHGVIMSVNNSLYCHGILKFGTEEQKKNFITPIATGKAIGAYSLTEPQSGSDAGAMKSRATRDGDFYILNGRKSWVTSGPVANYFVVFMMTDPDKNQKGVTAFLVDGNTPGLTRGKKEPKLGIRASATSELIFENCRIPAENRLGEEGEGFKIAMTVLDAGRIGIATQALGIAESAYEAARQYSGQREAFGQPIAAFQGTGFKIADMKTRIEASRLLIYNAAIAKENSKTNHGRYSLEASMAKLFASETAMFVTHQAIQIHGGMGYSKELPVERYFRDAKITEIYEGTSEIQRLVISRMETGLR